MRIVSLPWYDTALSRQSLNTFWLELRNNLTVKVGKLPEHLERSLSLPEQWAHPELLLSQCCGPDLFGAATGLEPFTRPVFELDCEPGSYFSYVVGKPNVDAQRIVINSPSSRSGCGSLLEWLDAQGWEVGSVVISGSHQASVQILRRGHADLAAIDAQSWKIIDTDDLNIIGITSAAPTPPYITRQSGDIPADILFAALELAVQEAGSAIGISGILPTDLELYRPLVQEIPVGLLMKAQSD